MCKFASECVDYDGPLARWCMTDWEKQPPCYRPWLEEDEPTQEEDELTQKLTKRYQALHAEIPEPTSYVSEDGLVLLPEDVIEDIGGSGGVCFVKHKDSKRYEIWTVDEFEERFLLAK